jgi:vacuolar-type H+-ATPase subunit F/Vma7
MGAARVMVMASAPIAEGFALLGIEAVPDATPEQLERVLEELFHRKQQALVLLDSRLGRSGGKWLKRVREESNRVIVVEIPGLLGPSTPEQTG